MSTPTHTAQQRGWRLLEERPAAPDQRCDRCGQLLTQTVFVFEGSHGAKLTLGPECRQRWDESCIPAEWWHISRKERQEYAREEAQRSKRMNPQDRIDGLPRWAWELADEELRAEGLGPRHTGWAGLRRLYAEEAQSGRRGPR